MSNSFGKCFRFTIFGQSHAPAIGVTMEGLPSGFEIDIDRLSAFMARRAPGGKYSTARKEADAPEFISGLVNGKTCGAPVTAIIRNNDTRSADYEYMKYIPRPGHADYTAMLKYGVESRDCSGGGQFSGRLTAPLCIAGGIAMQLLEKMGISVNARIDSVGGERDEQRIYDLIDKVRAEGDSVGGIISCTLSGVPTGIGEPMFDGVENRIAQAVFAIPAVKGIEFGAGFAAGQMRGSECNDPFFLSDGKLVTDGNNHGGILGGISSGMPISFRVAIKPTPSIARLQKSVDVKNGVETELQVRGRHDPCIVPRALPCVEAAAAAAVYDLYLENKMLQI